jgi:hypothetical protein
MFSRRARCYSLRKNKLRKKHDIVFVVRVEIQHHHLIDFFSECFENESMQNYSKIECCWKIGRWSDAMIKVEMMRWVDEKANRETTRKISLFEKD